MPRHAKHNVIAYILSLVPNDIPDDKCNAIVAFQINGMFRM